MKRFLTILMAISAIALVSSCKEDNPEVPQQDGPSVTWESNPEFKVADITPDLDADIKVTAPAGIKSFVVDVDSKELEGALSLIGIETTLLDLINDQKVIEILGNDAFGLPVGDEILNKTSVDFNITELVRLITPLADHGTEHSFELTVVDNNDVKAVQKCTFRVVKEEKPGITWESNPDFAPVEITEKMDVRLKITVPAGVETFVVNIDSAPLNAIGITSLDMVNPGSFKEIVDMVLAGQDIATATVLDLDLSTLVPMILMLNPANGSDHIFTMKLTDKAGNPLEQACTFHYTGNAFVVSDIDLWANTAAVDAGNATSVSYREKGTEEWVPAEKKDGKFMISPVWEKSQNEAGLDIYTLKEGTGIFAGNTYEFQVDGEILPVENDYTAAAGDAIPNGDMSGWSTKIYTDTYGKEYPILYPNAEGNKFWDSGNNYITEQVGHLCGEDESEKGVALLQSMNAIAFAAGNMFTGDFNMAGFSGVASFGKSYDWTSRPKALKLRYKSNVGKFDFPEDSEYLGQIDKGRIFAVVVDWTAQHSVTSGISLDPTITLPTGVWDPCEIKDLDEGAILGYASMELTESQNDFLTIEIPFEWYDTATKPTKEISLVISCTASYKGDYLTGCSTNKLWVDDFEWVY